MLKLVKIITLQVFWYIAVYFGKDYNLSIYFSAVFLAIINYIIFKPEVTKGHYAFVLLFFSLFGILQDSGLEKMGLIKYPQNEFPFWLNSLWVVFICYYGDIFNYMRSKGLAFLTILGAIGGAFAYFGGVKIAGITIEQPVYYLLVAISWGIFFPLSFKVFYDGLIWNKLMDMTIYYSFDLSGYIRHQKSFINDTEDISGKNILITGGTSGIGYSAAKSLEKLGNHVHITGRNSEKGNKAIEGFSHLYFHSLDMINWKELEKFVNDLPVLDHIVLNAGGMPESFFLNDFKIESQMASQLFGHYYLIRILKEQNKLAKDARIIWVSSGGMYLKSLDLTTISENPNYDKVATYANVKRAQVTLLETMANEFSDQFMYAMHPGWVDTPGVRTAISGFFEKMQGRLRNPQQGADTIVWLMTKKSPASSGKFYFDRKAVPIHLFGFTKKSSKFKNDLLDLINNKFKEI